MATQKIFTSEEALKRLEKLPPEVRPFIYSKEMRDILTNIGDKHKLHLDQLGNLETETVAVMLGFTEPQDFAELLVENARLTKQEAEAVVNDVNELILVKIRGSMKSHTPNKIPEIIGTSSPLTPATQIPILIKSSAFLSETNPQTEQLPTPPQEKANLNIQQVLSTSTTSKTGSSEPRAYKTDPYREPIE